MARDASPPALPRSLALAGLALPTLLALACAGRGPSIEAQAPPLPRRARAGVQGVVTWKAGADVPVCEAVGPPFARTLPPLSARGAGAARIARALDAALANASPPVHYRPSYRLTDVRCVSVGVPWARRPDSCDLVMPEGRAYASGGVASEVLRAFFAAGTRCSDPHTDSVEVANVQESPDLVTYEDATNYGLIDDSSVIVRGEDARRVVEALAAAGVKDCDPGRKLDLECDTRSVDPQGQKAPSCTAGWRVLKAAGAATYEGRCNFGAPFRGEPPKRALTPSASAAVWNAILAAGKAAGYLPRTDVPEDVIDVGARLFQWDGETLGFSMRARSEVRWRTAAETPACRTVGPPFPRDLPTVTVRGDDADRITRALEGALSAGSPPVSPRSSYRLTEVRCSASAVDRRTLFHCNLVSLDGAVDVPQGPAFDLLDAFRRAGTYCTSGNGESFLATDVRVSPGVVAYADTTNYRRVAEPDVVVRGAEARRVIDALAAAGVTDCNPDLKVALQCDTRGTDGRGRGVPSCQNTWLATKRAGGETFGPACTSFCGPDCGATDLRNAHGYSDPKVAFTPETSRAIWNAVLAAASAAGFAPSRRGVKIEDVTSVDARLFRWDGETLGFVLEAYP